jgi:hypothetical protein
MHIAVIGGLDRNAAGLAAIAAERKHTLEFHDGHIDGRGRDSLRRIIDRADLVIVETKINSHQAVRYARKLAGDLGRALVITGRVGVTAWVRCLDQLGQLGQAGAADASGRTQLIAQIARLSGLSEGAPAP